MLLKIPIDQSRFMADKLKKTYFALLIPAILALILTYAAKRFDLIPINSKDILNFIAPCIFVLAVAFAVALPIFFRALFSHKLRDQKSVSETDLMRFERNLIRIALVTPYLILPAYLLEFPRFYLAGIVLMALYAGYYFYPSTKRIQFERRIFRVK